MVLRRKLREDEHPIYEDGYIFQRNNIWQFTMYLAGEDKYVRKSLKTHHLETARKRAKIFYHEIQTKLSQGKKYFSITVAEAIDRYLVYRYRDVKSGAIVIGRHKTIEIHLKHFLEYIGPTTRISGLDMGSCDGYFQYRIDETKGKVKYQTLRNEASTINAMMKWLYELEKEGHISHFIFPKLPKIDYKDDKVRRQTFSLEEYDLFIRSSRSYTVCKNEVVSKTEEMERQLMHHWILIAANTGMRVGELFQLCWDDVEIEKFKDRNPGTTGQKRIIEAAQEYLANIRVRGETSKVRTSRTLIARGGHYFNRWKDIQKPASRDDLIFSLDGSERLPKKAFYRHWKEILHRSNIDEDRKDSLVPYSLRHFMVTQRFNSGVSLQNIAQMVGSSINQIERTYYHLDRETMMSNALSDYVIDRDGRRIVI